MAGVGFALKKVFRDSGGAPEALREEPRTALVPEIPLAFLVLLLLTLRTLMARAGAVYRQREEFLFLTTCPGIFSLLLAGTVLPAAHRFLPDDLCRERRQEVLPAFFGVVSFLLLAGGPAALAFLLTLPVGWPVRCAALTLFCVLLILWVQMAFLAAAGGYGAVLPGFGAGAAGALGLTALLLGAGAPPLAGALWGAALGLLAMMSLYMGQLLARYPLNRRKLRVGIPAGECSRSRAVLGLCMALGLYAHRFVFWAGACRDRVYPTGAFCLRYDLPCLFATLTLLPMAVRFAAGWKTCLQAKTRACFDAVRCGGRLQEIRDARQQLRAALYGELVRGMKGQLAVTAAAVVLGSSFWRPLGLDEPMAGTYRLLCCGYCLYGFVRCGAGVLRCLGDSRGALRAGALFLGVSTAGTLVTLPLDAGWWGTGFLAAGAAASCYVYLRIRRYLDELEYHVFCEQPALARSRLLRRVGERLDGARQKRTQGGRCMKRSRHQRKTAAAGCGNPEGRRP